MSVEVNPQTVSLDSSPELPTQSAGTSLGRYVVLGELGRGGMGVVLRAYDPKLQREVALKCLKPGVLSSDQGERLIREAQAMAKLSHPNVVAIYDVELESERVTLTMEYVEGQTLRKWLADHARSPTEILTCFIEAGRGLTAAHEAGLLHRDFKPANVLVSRSGTVKVTDFGLARLDEAHQNISADPEAVAGSLEDAIGPSRDSGSSRVLTQAGDVMGTPAYMAPEQHVGGSMTPAVDQYAFCVSLWQALTGSLPFPSAGGEQLRQVLELKLEGAPAWPKGTTHVHAKWVAAMRRGLSPNPAMRWPSMADLLAELSYDPTGKRRRRLTAGAVVLAVAGGLGWQTHGRAKATADCEAEGRALEATWNTDQAQSIADAFARTEIAYAPDTWLRAAPQVDAFADTWQQLRTRACLEGERDAQRSPDMLARARSCFDEQEAQLRSLARAWAAPNDAIVNKAATAAWALPQPKTCLDPTELARRSSPADDIASLATLQTLRNQRAEISALEATGQYEDALESAERVLQEAEALGRARLIAQARRTVGELQDRLGRYEDAKATLELAYADAERAGDDPQVLAIANALVYTLGHQLAAYADAHRWYALATLKRDRLGLGPEHPDVADSLHNIGTVYNGQGRFDEALTHYQRALEIRERTLGPDNPDVAVSLNNIGNLHESQGRFDEALTAHQRALEIRERALGAQHPSLAASLTNIGNVHQSQGHYAEALPYFERAPAILERALGAQHPNFAMSLNNLGNFYQTQGRYDEALSAHERALEIWERALGPEHPNVAMALNNLGLTHKDQGRYEEALTAQQRALAIWEKALGPTHPSIAMALNNIASAQHGLLRLDEALLGYQRAREILEQTLGPQHPDVAAAISNIGLMYQDQGRHEEALTQYQRALEIQQHALGPEHPDVASSLNDIGVVYQLEERYEEALEVHQRALGISERAFGLHFNVLRDLFGVSNAQLALGRPADAVVLLERALELCDAAGASASQRASVGALLDRARKAANRSRARP